MPTYEVDVQGKTYEVDAPDTNTAWQWANYTHNQSTKAAPPVKDAGFSLKDIGTAFGQGAVGSAQALTNVAGAGNAASQYLGGVSESLGKQYTPERQAEMQRQQERMKKAEESGSTWEEIKAAAQNIYEAPLQSAAQGLGSFVPYVPAIFTGPAAAALGLSSRAVAAANVVAKAYAPVIGTAQGAGSVKGAIYDAVYRAEKESGLSEAEARQKATAAQDYTGKNLDQIALGSGLGYIASKGGVEKFFTKEGREKAAEKLLPRVTKAVTEESATEGAQGGQERLASNIALQRTGRNVPTFQGVAGQAAQEGIIGGLTAGAVSLPQSGKAPVEDLTKRASTKAGQEALDIALPPPAPERVKDVEPVINPPIGASVPVASEREVVQPTEGAIAPEGVGVGTTVPPVVPITTGEGEQPAALNPGLQKIYDAYATRNGKTGQGSEDLAIHKIKRLTDLANIHNQPINVWLHQGEIVTLGANVPKPKFARLIGTVNPTGEAPAATEVVTPPQAQQPAALDIPEEVKEDKTLASQPTYTEGSVSEVPVSELKLSEDVPQFKSDANQAGVVQTSKLEGKFDRRLASPIQVWQRDNGALEVISGRHRLDLAQRSGEKTIPAQIYKESEGFNADMARMLDIELNVKDGRGKVKDYVSFFKEFNLPKDQARSEGLLNTAIGRQAYEIADAGSPSLIAAHFNKEISDDAATSIAINAPKDDALQNLGMAQVKDGKSINHAVNFMRSAMAAGFKGQEGSGDLFGFDDSFAKEAEAVTKEATKQQRDARQQLAAIKGAAKSPEKAKLGGVDVKNLEQTKAKIAELEKTVNDLENFHTNPELYKKLRQDAGLEEGLTAPTPDELKAAEERAKLEESRIASENKAAEDKAKADAEVDEFGLTGSDRAADADPNQEAMFSLREATPEQMNEADAHAKDFGGAVVYQNGDVALVRAFSSVTGQPVYLVAKGDTRSRVDIESYTGKMISESEKQELIAEKKKLEAEDAKKHKENPFITFNKNGLSFSKGVPVQVGKVLAGWKDLLKLAPNIYITTVEDARDNRNNFTGEHRAIGSVGLDYKQRGVMRQLPSGDYYVAFTKSTSITKMLETLAHELGHIHQKEVFEKSSLETKVAIKEEYQKWLQTMGNKTARELVNSLRAKTTGKTTKVPDNLTANQLTSYWKSFSEWYADQTAKWAVTSEKPVGIVEKYFKRLGEALRSFYAKVRNSGYLPNETFKKYLDTVTKENIEQHLIVSKPEDQMALFMKSEVEPVEIEKAGTEKGQEALDITGGLGRVSEKPDSSYMKQVREAWDNATNNPKATASEAKAAIIKFIDLIQTKAFSSDAAINNSIRREVNEFVKDNEQAIGTMLNISQSQVVHADALANLFLTSGNLKYNKDLYKYEAVEDKSNIVELAKQLGEIKNKYGLTQAQTELIGHTAFEAKRLKSLLQFNNQVDQEVAEMRAEADKLAMDGKEVAAHALREKATRRSKETKFIHMTGAEISAGNKLFKVIPELNGVVDTWNQMRDNAANLLVDSGLWSKDEAEFLLSNADYVPFFREEQLEKGKGPKEYIRGLMVQAQEKKLKGSSKPVNDIFDNMNRWMQYSVNRAVRNRSALALIDTASEFGQAKRIESKSDGDNAIRVWRNGKEEFYDMADPMFVEAFTGLESISIPAWKWASTVANILRQSVVLNPLFTVAQIPQDAFAAMFTSGLKAPYALQIPARAVKEFLKTLAHRSATNNELKKYGVVGVRDFTSQMARLDAQVYAGMKSSPGILGKLKSVLEHVAMAGDNAVRQATYEAATAQGLSKAEALEKSFEIWNIRRKGTSQSLAIASQVIPFFGAYLAAQNVALKTISGVGTSPTERKAALGALVGTTASVMTLSLLYAMMNGDDEDYLKKPAAIRDRMLMVPGTSGFGIPLRSDLFSIPKIITEHMYLMMTDKGYEDGRKFRDSMKNALGNSFFSPTVVPQAIKPGLEVMVNYDFFQGRPLIGEYQKRLEKERQFNESTSELAKILGNTGLVSPISADHLIRGMFGSAGGLIIYMTNPLLHSDPNVDKPTMSTKDMLATLPGASSFVSKDKESALKADFYVLRDEVTKVTNTLSDLKQRNPEKIAEYIADPDVMAKLTVSKGVQGIDKKLGEIRKAMTRISNLPTSVMDSDEKQQQIKQLREAETTMLKAINVKNLREMAKI